MEYYVVVKKFVAKSGKNCTLVVLENADGYSVSTLGWGDDFAQKFGASFADLNEASSVGYKVLGTFTIKN